MKIVPADYINFKMYFGTKSAQFKHLPSTTIIYTYTPNVMIIKIKKKEIKI